MYNCPQINHMLLVHMFIDWIDMYQDFDNVAFPQLSDIKNIIVDTTSGEILRESQPTHIYEGSFSTKINIRISNGRIYVSGNPSRINRPDNLFGFQSIDKAVNCYNTILNSLGLPIFTKSSGLKYIQSKNDRFTAFSDGAIFTRLDITTNIEVGKGNVSDYLKGVSTLRYRHLVPHLHTNGYTVDWVNHKGKEPSLIYACVYNKEQAIKKFDLPKVKRIYGERSPEYDYITKVYNHCIEYGVVRYEQKLRAQFLRNNPQFRFYGLSELSDFESLHSEFLAITNKLQVTAMSLESISQRLLRLEICQSTKAANTTAMYAILWMAGQQFACKKTQEQIHRARLNKIGIDINAKCDISRHSTVYVKKAKEVTETIHTAPSWYEKPKIQLQLVA